MPPYTLSVQAYKILACIGLSIMLINPNIDTFIVKFGWTEDNQSTFISMLSMINPLGGLFGVFIAKYLIEKGRLKTIIIADVVIIIATSLVRS
jgi:fucose permease